MAVNHNPKGYDGIDCDMGSPECALAAHQVLIDEMKHLLIKNITPTIEGHMIRLDCNPKLNSEQSTGWYCFLRGFRRCFERTKT